MGRNLANLRMELGGNARDSFQQLAQLKNNVPKVQVQKIEGVSSPAALSPTGTVQSDNFVAWTFGELPELLEIVQASGPGRARQTIIGYPALVDKETSCQLQVFDDPEVAAKTHQSGLVRLFALQLKDQLKFLEKNIPGLQQMGMQFMSLGSQEELRKQIIGLALERAFLQAPLPKNADQFLQRKEEGRARLNLLANEIARLVGVILAEFVGLSKKIQGVKSSATSDMQTQLHALMTKRFILETPYSQLVHYPRYLKAIAVRVEKMRTDPGRDGKLMQEWNQASSEWQRTSSQAKSNDKKLQEYRWLLEELRVSLFAQELKTPMPVSVKRLQKVWESMQR
jgi:ATP-dependent helicase HrpA